MFISLYDTKHGSNRRNTIYVDVDGHGIFGATPWDETSGNLVHSTTCIRKSTYKSAYDTCIWMQLASRSCRNLQGSRAQQRQLEVGGWLAEISAKIKSSIVAQKWS
jgi:hypothetical protein